MAITWSSSVSGAAEVYNTRKENFNAESGDTSCSVQLRVPYSSRYTLINELVGGRAPWPFGPGAFPPRAFSAACVPEGSDVLSDTQGVVYNIALVTVNYSTKAKELISESLEPSAEFLTLDYRRFRWAAANGEPILENEAPGKLRHGLNLVRTLHDVAGPLPVSMLTLPGSCNNDDYTSTLLGLTFAEETLLFGTPNISRVIKTTGAEGFTIRLSFTHKPSGWNKFWRAKTEDYAEMFDVNGGGARFINYPPEDYSDYLF